MAASTIEALRQEVHEYINNSDERMIKAIHAMLEADKNQDWWDETSLAQKNSIERGIKDMEEGNTVPHEEMIKLYSRWLTK